MYKQVFHLDSFCINPMGTGWSTLNRPHSLTICENFISHLDKYDLHNIQFQFHTKHCVKCFKSKLESEISPLL